MRLVFVNHAHPDTRHVSAMRLSYFARALAQRGHQVVLLTGPNPIGITSDPTLQELEEALLRHDWSEPFVLAVANKKMWRIHAIRNQSVPSFVRRGMTAWSFLIDGGMFGDWTRRAWPVSGRLAGIFRPDLVWATFGNTSNLELGKLIAGRASCPWVLDVKDNWTAFVPAGLRKMMAWRFRNASGISSNADHHLAIAVRWLHSQRTQVIYSGVADPFFYQSASPSEQYCKDILLVGSTYDRDTLKAFLSALRDWLFTLTKPEQSTIRFVYAGSDASMVSVALAELQLPCRIQVMTHLPIEELAHRATRSIANCYIWAPFTFHHKLLELLVAGRPVIAFPGEHEESRALATQCDTDFHVCNDPEELVSAFQAVWAGDLTVRKHRVSVPPWHWNDFAVELERFFIEVCDGIAA